MSKHNSGSVMIWLIAGALLLFTGFRSVHLVSSTLPADAQILGFAALAALDLGLLAWLVYATRGARGAQRTIAVLMICVDLAGVSAAVIGDTMLIGGGSSASGLVSTVALWVLPVIVIANVAATVACHLLDPNQAMRDANRALQDELDWQVARGIQSNASQVAANVTPAAIEARQREMIAGFMSGIKELEKTSAKSNNGKGAPQMATMADDSPEPVTVEAQPVTQSGSVKDVYPLKTNNGMRYLHPGESFNVDHAWTSRTPQGGTEEMQPGIYTYDGNGILSYDVKPAAKRGRPAKKSG